MNLASAASSSAPEPEAPEVGAFFDERAQRYDRRYDGPGGYALRSRMKTALELLGPGPGEALDVGMGPGRLVAELARRDWTVSGIDASAAMVAVARSRVPEAASRLVQGKIEFLPYADAAFDAVVATGVLEYSEVERALLELARVLRPGGLAVVSCANPRNLYALWRTRVWYRFVRTTKRIAQQHLVTFPRGSGAFRPDQFRELLAAAGLQPKQVEYTSFLLVPSPLDELLPRLTERLGRQLEGSRSRLGRRLASHVVYAAEKAMLADDSRAVECVARRFRGFREVRVRR